MVKQRRVSHKTKRCPYCQEDIGARGFASHEKACARDYIVQTELAHKESWKPVPMLSCGKSYCYLFTF